MPTFDLSLYAVTPNDCPLWAIEAALRGGATMLQLREKNLPLEDFITKARAVLALCRGYQVPLIINDSVPVALAVGADGVHLGQNDMPSTKARRLLGDAAIIGVTARTPELARRAQADGASYLGAGAVFGTSTKADAIPLSLADFTAVCHSVTIPVVAIGGITTANAPRLAGSSLAGLAVVSGLFGHDLHSEEASRQIAKNAADLLTISRALQKSNA